MPLIKKISLIKSPRKWLLSSLILLLIIAGLTVFYSMLDGFLAPEVRQQLSERLDADVRIEGFSFGLITGTHIDRLTIRPATEDEQAPAPLVLSGVKLDHHLLSLFAGRYSVKHVRIESFDARVSQDSIQWLSSIKGGDSFPSDMPDIPEIELDRGDLAFDLPTMRKSLQIEDLRLFIWQSDARRIRGVFSFASGGNAVKMQFTAMPERGYMESEVQVRGFDLAALPAVNLEAYKFDPARLRVRGLLTGKLVAFSPEKSGEFPELVGQFTMTGISVSHPDIALSMTEGMARVDLADNAISLRDGDFNFAGGSVDIPAAGLRFGRNGIERIWARTEVQNVDLTSIQDVGGFRIIPRKFRPQIHSGTAYGMLNAQWSPAEGLTYGADVKVRDISGALLDRPEAAITTLDAEGSIYSPGRVKIRNGRGRIFGGRVEADGTFELSGKSIEAPSLELRFNDIEQNDTLIEMLPASVRKALDLVGIEGGLAGGTIKLEPGGLDLDLSVKADAIGLPTLPFRLEDPSTGVKWASGTGKVIFDECKAYMEGSPVEGSGALLLGKPLSADFNLRGRHLPVTQPLLDWLQVDLRGWQTGGSFDVVMQANDWRPVKGSVIKSIDGLKAQADLIDVYLYHPKHGRVGENGYGHLTLGTDGLQLTNLRGDLFGIGVRGSGTVPIESQKAGPYMHLESETISLGPNVLDRLPFDHDLGEFDPTGQIKLQGELQGGNSGGKRMLDGNITAIVYHLGITPGTIPVTASGTAQIRLRSIEYGRPVVSGSVALSELTVGRLEGDRLSADFKYDHPSLRFENTKISAYGGKIQLRNPIFNVQDRQWEAEVDVSHVDLESFIGTFGIKGREAPSGVMRIGGKLKGKGFAPEGLEGVGEIKIDRGRLYSFPLLVSVLSVFDLKLPSQSPVTDAYGVFSIGKGKIVIEDFLFTGGSVPIHLEGKVGLKNHIPLKSQEVDLLVTVAKDKSFLDRIPILNFIKHYTIDLLRRLIFQARVKGSLDDYEINSLSSPVTRPIQKMWSLLEKITPSPPGE